MTEKKRVIDLASNTDTDTDTDTDSNSDSDSPTENITEERPIVIHLKEIINKRLQSKKVNIISIPIPIKEGLTLKDFTAKSITERSRVGKYVDYDQINVMHDNIMDTSEEMNPWEDMGKAIMKIIKTVCTEEMHNTINIITQQEYLNIIYSIATNYVEFYDVYLYPYNSLDLVLPKNCIYLTSLHLKDIIGKHFKQDVTLHFNIYTSSNKTEVTQINIEDTIVQLITYYITKYTRLYKNHFLKSYRFNNFLKLLKDLYTQSLSELLDIEAQEERIRVLEVSVQNNTQSIDEMDTCFEKLNIKCESSVNNKLFFANTLIITHCIDYNMEHELIFNVYNYLKSTFKRVDIHENKNPPSKVFIPVCIDVNSKLALFVVDFDKKHMCIYHIFPYKGEWWKPSYNVLKYLIPRFFGVTEFIDWEIKQKTNEEGFQLDPEDVDHMNICIQIMFIWAATACNVEDFHSWDGLGTEKQIKNKFRFMYQ